MNLHTIPYPAISLPLCTELLR